MSDLVIALCNRCGTTRTVGPTRKRSDPFWGTGDRCVERRCRTCRSSTQHAMLLPESVAAAFNAADDAERDHQAAGLRAFEDARDQLSAMGVSVLMRDVAPEDRVRGVVLREFDRDGRFTVIVDGRGGAEQRSEILREAVDVILRHDAYRWHIASPEDHRGVGAATSFAFVTISPAGSASSQVGSPRPRAQ